MNEINVSASSIEKYRTSIGNSRRVIEKTVRNMSVRLKEASSTWDDSNYRSLESISVDCVESLKRIYGILIETDKYLGNLLAVVKDYENAFDEQSGFRSGSQNSSGATTNNIAGNGETPYSLRSLAHTNQEKTKVFLNGRNCIVFDHPFEENPQRICNQGSAYPTGPQNTCGCCSSGTIVNKAGGNTNEHDMVALAWNNGLCDNDGFTTAETISDLLTMAGVSSSVTSGSRLSDLASSVEDGHGVIIAVNARRFDPSFYRQSGGHALVLESVVRDAETNDIIEYVVIDSNRENSVNSVRRVEAGQLERAFRDFGNQSISTNNIIW